MKKHQKNGAGSYDKQHPVPVEIRKETNEKICKE